MRLLLDAHISGRKVGEALRDLGHDVVAADSERRFIGMPDAELLEIAASENRLLVTFDAADFARIIAEWMRDERRHAGCVILVRMDHSEFGLIIRSIQSQLEKRPQPGDWRDYVCFVSPKQA